MNDHDRNDEPLILKLHSVIRFAVRVMALIMTAVIIWGVVDVCWVLYEKLMSPPRFLLTISDILATFGAFMAVLIAIEIFVNICVYLREDVIHVQIVMATALMAIARKIIILDFSTIGSEYVWAIAGVVFSMSIGYFLVLKSSKADVSNFDRILFGNQNREPDSRHKKDLS
ncbi:phosphate-starvation-inducible PsiE family protein [Desulfobacula sp.]|uniref:phosphate-starvation-inducible PsiE family protein n=1 Tax=Desulfobacula sp. TaxID=2593537 RepID=UPI0026030964|nr:phosphate-starvation-inducible PsiE family protein [Desulfobacula sp.]